MNNTKTCNSLALQLGGFYRIKEDFNSIYRYVGMYGKKRVLLKYGYDCTDRTGIWYFRCKNQLICTHVSYDSFWLPVNIDKNGRFTVAGDIECELLHNICEFEVFK